MTPTEALSPQELDELKRLHADLGTLPFGTTRRTVRKVAKAFLHEGWWTWNGRFCDPVAKHVGLGVYDVSVKELETNS